MSESCSSAFYGKAKFISVRKMAGFKGVGVHVFLKDMRTHKKGVHFTTRPYI